MSYGRPIHLFLRVPLISLSCMWSRRIKVQTSYISQLLLNSEVNGPDGSTLGSCNFRVRLIVQLGELEFSTFYLIPSL